MAEKVGLKKIKNWLRQKGSILLSGLNMWNGLMQGVVQQTGVRIDDIQKPFCLIGHRSIYNGGQQVASLKKR
ncbi:Uncharacterised protein [Enterobacter hormaechei]|nr:Uncharacterised protein [Enterobacter hormaechei]CZV55703.1 Uncharacterised protein [Enterobacter hormaechei]SAD52572.1 Uncharacterised protein [Enterobacter hormaechei]SAG78461.1 Uncharacterised protein [Enterobacter hormaechei]SAJ21823.1 Uncharacterised protein [Enterobacter hormaechei]